jgi:hypothetical protein
MFRHRRHARVLQAAAAIVVTATLSAAPIVASAGAPVLLAGPERCC